MRLNELLDEAEKRPALLLVNLREIRDEIHNEHKRAPTFGQRGALLAIYKSVMDYVEGASNFEPEGLEKFKKTRRQDYCLFLARECAQPDGNVDPVMMEAVTRREVDAGRMAEDDELRVLTLQTLENLRELENTESRRRQKEAVSGGLARGGRGMLARLGNVLYWLGCIIAWAIIALVIASVDLRQLELGNFIFFGGMALAAWLAGRACRYILAGT
jgi:hypothetical protein